MLNLVWALLNIVIFLFFLITCVRAARLVREKLGLLACVIFVFGLLSFMSNPSYDQDNNAPGSSKMRTFDFVDADSLSKNGTHLTWVELEETLVSKLELDIKYAKDIQGSKSIPISASSVTTGFVSGIDWKPSAIMINATGEDNKVEYYVKGTMEWKLLGATIYSQLKEYKGIALAK